MMVLIGDLQTGPVAGPVVINVVRRPIIQRKWAFAQWGLQFQQWLIEPVGRVLWFRV